jgi:hypothetical protein
MSRMWPSVRSCVDVSACRCRGHMKPELRTSTAYQRELRCSSALFPSALALGTCQRKLAGWPLMEMHYLTVSQWLGKFSRKEVREIKQGSRSIRI